MAGTGDEVDLQRVEGVRLLERVRPMLARLHADATGRDRAGNRQLFFDQVCSLILLTFFNPTLKTLRDLHGASKLARVRKKLDCSTASMGSLSESLRVFDPQLLVEIVQELLGQRDRTVKCLLAEVVNLGGFPSRSTAWHEGSGI